LKYVFRKDEQLGILEEIGLALREAPESLYQVVLYIILTYENADDAALQKLIRIAKPEEETKMMSLFAKEILAKGNPEVWAMVRQESEQKGMVEILLGQLQERFGSLPDWARSKLADADLDTLKRWSKKIFGAEKIEQIFQ
ncbi:MAG: hypothetical protein HQL55_15830, partial [Magnetococcales bacterium]|nr:hypothetical protein [Magnetococcales bacterium]